MGVDYNVYLGPYLKCQNPDVDKQVTKLTCPNTSCAKHMQWRGHDPFCAKCGSQIVDVTTTQHKPRVCGSSLLEELNEVFYAPGTCYAQYPFEDHVDVWIPNTKPKTIFGSRQASFDARYDTGMTRVCPSLIEDETDAFKRVFVKELTKMCEAYGADCVSIHWGLLSYAS